MALAILDANRSKLLSVDDDGEAMTILSEYLDNITNKEYDSPFKSAASSIRGTSVGGVGSYVTVDCWAITAISIEVDFQKA